jgi:(E)-4-hydroxy-3-methylbut-2-enyl-diphosphate synthase
MGCVVNGPGEARDADVGIAGGKRYGPLFREGKIIGKVKEKNLVDALLDVVHDLTE